MQYRRPTRSLPERTRRAIHHYQLLAGRGVRRPFIEYHLRHHAHNLDQSLLLSSIPRSGSNWLMEMLVRSIPGAVPNYEPLHKTNGPTAGLPDWPWCPVLPAGAEDPAAASLLRDMLTLRRRTDWTTSYIRLRHLRAPRFILTKTVRATQLLPFIARDLGLVHRPVLLMRHPISTSSSHLNTFGRHDTPENFFDVTRSRHTERRFIHRAFLTSLTDPLVFQVGIWCLRHTYVVQDPALEGRVIPVFYEDLVREPRLQLDRILSNWGMNQAPRQISLRRRSKTDHDRRLLRDPTDQIEKAIAGITVEQRDRMREVFDHFGLRIYSVDDPLPRPGALFGGADA